ncbi:MAG: hypothetical protein PUI12_04715, partial [Bacteroidales bacterium]|nr:hypothetical protein [Bacteroidales bacterium]MDY5280414.1 hypothetical protein [Sodaliphilus sp.]
PPNARTPPATKKRTPPIIESWECPYVISKKNGNIAPLPTFSVLSKYHVPTGFGFSPKTSGFCPFVDATDLDRCEALASAKGCFLCFCF